MEEKQLLSSNEDSHAHNDKLQSETTNQKQLTQFNRNLVVKIIICISLLSIVLCRALDTFLMYENEE